MYINCVSVRDFLLALCISFLNGHVPLNDVKVDINKRELEEEEEEDLDGVFHNTRKLLLSVVVETIKNKINISPHC